MKKIVLTLVILLIAGKAFCQQSPYTLPLPEKWGVEKIPFPISFAPGIPFKGNEEIRFTPGWGKADSEEYWSYTFLWFIEGKPQIDTKTLQKYFTEYFNGLFAINNKTKPTGDGSITKAAITKITTSNNDQETYEGKIVTLNFLTGKPLELFARIHVRDYDGLDHSVLLVELSPQPYMHEVWGKLDGIVNGFEYKSGVH